MPTVCVYSIMKNEARHVVRWYEAAKEADCHLLLDTGSSDNSIELAEELGIETDVALFEPFRFDDARNTALALVPHDIDIVIQVDLDETLEPGWRQALDEVQSHHRRWSYMVRNDDPTHGFWDEVPHSNCHRRFGFRWHHPIHEVISGPPVDAHLDGLVVTHRPDDGKPRNYIDLLTWAAADDPTSARMCFYLGREQIVWGRWDQARVTLMRFLEMDTPWPAERSEAYLMLGTIDHHPERWFLKAIAECPERREPWALASIYHAKHSRWLLASAYYELARERTDRTIYVNRRECWGHDFGMLGKRIASHL